MEGSGICDSAVTVDGWLDDPTATVTATLVDAGGNTNIFSGRVDRAGGYSIADIPVPAGTSTLTLMATDAWGNTTTSNMTLTSSPLQVWGVGLRDGSYSLFQPMVTVSGWTSDAVTAVRVNGVAAEMPDWGGSFTASGVPVNDLGNGVVRFEIVAQDAETNQAGFTVDFVKPDHLTWRRARLCRRIAPGRTTFMTGRLWRFFGGFREDVKHEFGSALGWTNGLPAAG